jgi:hypothetical protein
VHSLAKYFVSYTRIHCAGKMTFIPLNVMSNHNSIAVIVKPPFKVHIETVDFKNQYSFEWGKCNK